MKTISKILAPSLMIILALIANISWAQESSQLLMIHQDYVIPSEYDNYVKAAKNMAEAMKEHEITSIYNYANVNDENVFIHASPMASLADLDKDPWVEMREKMGDSAFESMMDGFNGTYTHHRNFVVAYQPKLSYMPDIPEGENYRRWHYWYANADEGGKARKELEKWVAFYKAQGSETGFRVYTSVLGEDWDLLVILFWAKDAAHWDEKWNANLEKLGEETADRWTTTKSYLRKIERKTGWYLPDASHVPSQSYVNEKAQN